jgi:hypothetical protein
MVKAQTSLPFGFSLMVAIHAAVSSAALVTSHQVAVSLLVCYALVIAVSHGHQKAEGLHHRRHLRAMGRSV